MQYFAAFLCKGTGYSERRLPSWCIRRWIPNISFSFPRDLPEVHFQLCLIKENENCCACIMYSSIWRTMRHLKTSISNWSLKSVDHIATFIFHTPFWMLSHFSLCILVTPYIQYLWIFFGKSRTKWVWWQYCKISAFVWIKLAC